VSESFDVLIVGSGFGGSVAAPTAPGLGVSIDEARVREAAKDAHRWRNPIWRGPDGSLREW